MPILPRRKPYSTFQKRWVELTLTSSTKRVVSLAEAITGLKTHVDEGYTAKKRSFCRTGLR